MKSKSLHPQDRLQSFRYAFAGIAGIFRQEPNAKLHAVASILAIGLGFYRHITSIQWIALVIVISLVWITEALNTCVEELCDLWCKGEIHPRVKIIKDIAAGAVLIAAIAAVITGLIIFLS